MTCCQEKNVCSATAEECVNQLMDAKLSIIQVISDLQDMPRKSRDLSVAITNLQTGGMWLELDLLAIQGSMSKDKEVLEGSKL